MSSAAKHSKTYDFRNRDTFPTLLEGGRKEWHVNLVDVPGEVEFVGETNYATVTMGNVLCSNGVVHIVDSVLIPIFSETSLAADAPGNATKHHGAEDDAKNAQFVSSEVSEFVTWPVFPPDICVPSGACTESDTYLGSDCCDNTGGKYASGGCHSGYVCKQPDCVPDGGCSTSGAPGFECCTGHFHDGRLFDHPWCGDVCGPKHHSVSV